MSSEPLGYRYAQGLAYGDYEQATARKRTRRERFLGEMENVVPWKALIDLIEPNYPKTSSKGGRPPYLLATTLRIHLLLQWYDLSDPAMEDALIEVSTMRRFAGIDMISDRIPDETTIISFRHLLEKHDLGKKIFRVVKAHLKVHGMATKLGTIKAHNRALSNLFMARRRCYAVRDRRISVPIAGKNSPKQANFSCRKGGNQAYQASDPPEIVHYEQIASLDPLSGTATQRLPLIKAVPFGSQSVSSLSKAYSLQGPLRVLHLGWPGQLKGASYALDTIDILGPRVTIALIAKRPVLDCIPSNLALRKHQWIESLPHEKILDQMACHDEPLLPSLLEGYALVISEALKRGLPVITAPISGAIGAVN